MSLKKIPARAGSTAIGQSNWVYHRARSLAGSSGVRLSAWEPGTRAGKFDPDAVMGISRPGRKIVYTGDTKAVHMTIQEFAHDADLLIHDATYDESEAERGAEFFHATAAQAGEAACRCSMHASLL